MTREKADLIIHPARLQILQVLSRRPLLTTSQIAEELPALPKSSLYRHLDKLLQGGMVRVEKTRQIRGGMEKYFSLAEPPHLSSSDLQDFSAADHVRLFTAFTATLIQEFSDYVHHAGNPDLAADRTGYTVMEALVTQQELDDFGEAFSSALKKLVENSGSTDRHLHKLVLVSHPLVRGGNSDE